MQKEEYNRLFEEIESGNIDEDYMRLSENPLFEGL